MSRALPKGPHCEGPDCGADFCTCECSQCILVPTFLANLQAWSTQLRTYQVALDVFGGDRNVVARVAGNVLDLAEGLERAADNLRGRFS